MDAVFAALAAGRPLVPVTGPAGIGRTTALSKIGALLSERGARFLAIRFSPGGDAVPVHLPGADPGFAPFGPVAGAHRDPEIARRAAAAAAAALLRGGGEVSLLIDDAHWIDRDSRAVLGALVRRLAGTSAICVCAIRTPMPADWQDWLGELRRDALVCSARLRPMTAAAIAGELATATGTTPDDELVLRVRRLSRGIPAAVCGAIEMVRRSGSVQLVETGACLVPGGRSMNCFQDNGFLRFIRGLHPMAVKAATATCVFAPLGEAVPRLVAEVLERDEAETGAVLEALRRGGVLHRGRNGHSWRIIVPFVAAALTAGTGPFERRQLAAAAVTAVWTGRARCADPDHLADLVADAGRLIDPALAFTALLERSAEAGERKPWRASRWLSAAVGLAEDPGQLVTAMLALIEICHACGDHERSLRGAQLLLTRFADRLEPDVAQEVQVKAVGALKSIGDDETLRKIGESWRGWREDPTQRPVISALALGMLDRWAEARDALGEQWRAGSATTVLHGSLLEATAALWTGHSGLFRRLSARTLPEPVGAGPQWLRRRRTDWVAAQVTASLVIGESAHAEKLLAEEDLDVDVLPWSDRAMLAALRGQVEPAKGDGPCGHHIGYSAASQAIISLLVAQGKLATARKTLTAAREARPRFGHLLDIAEAQIHCALGETELGTAKLLDCERVATECGLAVGMDLCWAERADLALETGEPVEAKRCLVALEKLAETMPTSRVLMHAKLVRSLVDGDPAVVEDCLALVRRRGHPLETATAYERLVRWGAADPDLLNDAYRILGVVDAPLYRSWLRNLMREHGIVVPGRARTAAENEHLLAVLVADGLTNRQLATALRVSEKSVENRLSRLFARTGYRSRIELSAAIREAGALPATAGQAEGKGVK